jgi:hypothetical protein
MANDDLRNLWQGQPLENTPMLLDEIRARASRFERRISRRNLREFLAGVFVVIVYAGYIWKLPQPLVRIGSAMIIVGVLFVMWQLYRRGRASRLPADLGAMASLDFHRRQLVQQRDLARTVFRWYLSPFLPGMFVMFVGLLGPRALQWRYLPRMVPFLALLAGVFGGIWWINRRGAERLSRQIAELDRLEKQ